MKPRKNHLLPQTLVVCFAPLLACASARGSIVSSNETQVTNEWVLPTGTNLLAGATVTASAVLGDHGEGTSTNLAVLTDGGFGIPAGTDHSASVSPANGTSITYALDLSSHPAGRNITAFDSYCAWDNSGRDNQNYMLQYSTVANPGTFITISTVNLQTADDRSTHARLTDNSGLLAAGVHSIRLIFDRQENNYVGYREFVLRDTPVVVAVDNAARNDNAWSPLVGPNLLNGATATPSTVATHENSSGSWTTLTDGQLGTADMLGNTQSVTPNNNDTVTFPLDLVAKPAGYDITSFESYCAWGSSGRDDQRYTLEYSTVGAPATFLPITEVFNHTEWTPTRDSGRKSTRTRVTANGGKLALGVAAIRVTFHNQENGYTGFREFILRDTPLATSVVRESNSTNIWTLPSGTNLLANALPKTPTNPADSNHDANNVTSSDWSVLTDGLIGSADNALGAVAPLSGTFVIFPLDTSTNKGYNLTSLDTYAAWRDSGRDDQNYTVSYSTKDLPDVFIPIGTINNQTLPPDNATHSRIVANAGSVLGSNVGAIRFDFTAQENNWVGFREFIALGNAVPLFDTLTWSGLSGSGTWIPGADNNWREGAVSAPYNPLAPLAFDNTGINTSIAVAAGVSAYSLTFTNDATHPYTFSGQSLAVANGLFVAGSGGVTFGNSLQASGIELSGSGSLTLSTNNPLSGTTNVSNGTLNVSANGGLGNSSLNLSGGTVKFTSAAPSIRSLSGTGGNVILGGAGRTDLSVGDLTIPNFSTFDGSITNASTSAVGGLIKEGQGTLTLNGINSYSGSTTVNDGELKLGKLHSLYNGNTASWTASNLVVYGRLGLRVGGVGEFTGADVAALNTGGFADTGVLGLDTSSGNTEISAALTGGALYEKQGANTLKLTGANTFTRGITVTQGALELARSGGPSIPSDLTVGNATFDAYANMAANNQFGPNVLLKFKTGKGAVNGKVQLRGTNQTVAGLESTVDDRLVIIQNDDTLAPGYTVDPAPASLTIDTPADSFHSFHGIIRNGSGASLSLIKNGLGTQEFINSIDNNSYNGPTTVNQGKFRFNFAGGTTGFGSNIAIAAPAVLEFHAVAGDHNFYQEISGAGHVLVNGTSAVRFFNNNSSWTGGTTVGFVSDDTNATLYQGFLALDGNGSAGNGTALGQNCAGGAMIPSNLITVENGATLALDGIAPLGNSPVLPQFAPSVRITANSTLYSSSVSFVSNITLDGGKIEITSGGNAGNFGTSITFVGTLKVGGTVPARIVNSANAAGPFANASLGSIGLPGTIFDVANVTGDAATDLQVGAILRNVGTVVSPLVKTGPGTMSLEGVNTYTGDTTVSEGELLVNGSSIADTNKLVIAGGKVGIAEGVNEAVGALFYGGVQQVDGTYGSADSPAIHKDSTRFSGKGIITVTAGLVTTFEQWASVIPDATQRGRTADPDGDGFSNLEEFLFGTSPIANTGSLTTFEKSGANLVIRWSQRAAGTYTLKESTTLLENSWTNSTLVPVNSLDQNGLYSNDYTRKEAVIPVDSARKFLRVEAIE